MKEQMKVWYRCRWPTILVVAIAATGLTLQPLPECFDCEPNEFALHYPHYNIAAKLFFTWFLGSSFLAGLLPMRWPLLMPFGITFCDLATQHLGGVPWWSLRENEGPVLLLFDLAISLAALGCGAALGSVLRRRAARQLHTSRPGDIH